MTAVATLLPTRALSTEDLVRVRASTDERQSTVLEWHGHVLYVDAPIFDLYFDDHNSYIVVRTNPARHLQ